MTAPLWIIARDVLGEGFFDPLLEHVVGHSKRWQMASLGHGENITYQQGRMAWVLPDDLFPESIGDTFLPYLLDVAPHAFRRLEIPEPREIKAEVQVTAYHNRGGFIRHTDSGRDLDPAHPHAYRRLTFVYYFWKRPKAWSGGNLHFPDHDLELEPALDSLVCFNPDTPHAVLPVFTGSKAPDSCRFTVNGWLGEAEEFPA